MELKTIIYKCVLITILCIAQSSVVLASDVGTPQSTLYNYRNSIEIYDDFLGATTASGNIGQLQWFAANGTTTQIGSVANRFGVIRRDTSGVINTLTRFILSTYDDIIDPAVNTIVNFQIRLNNNDANTTVRIGLANSLAVSPPGDGIFFEKLDADTNWFCVVRVGGVQTRVDSTIAVNTSFNGFQYTRNSSGVQFSINNVNVCGVISTNIPTIFIAPGLHINNSAAVSKTIDIDYFSLRMFGIVR